MAWTEFTDETLGPSEHKHTCKRCLQKIKPEENRIQ